MLCVMCATNKKRSKAHMWVSAGEEARCRYFAGKPLRHSQSANHGHKLGGDIGLLELRDQLGARFHGRIANDQLLMRSLTLDGLDIFLRTFLHFCTFFLSLGYNIFAYW